MSSPSDELHHCSRWAQPAPPTSNVLWIFTIGGNQGIRIPYQPACEGTTEGFERCSIGDSPTI